MKTLPPIPSEQDWGDYAADLDQAYAHKIFFGKAFTETFGDFERSVIDRVDEIRFMAVIPFRYYLLALREYVLSYYVLTTESASDAASCFLRLVLEKLENFPEQILPVMDVIMPAVEYVAEHQSLFDADVEVYGEFKEHLARIRQQYADALKR